MLLRWRKQTYIFDEEPGGGGGVGGGGSWSIGSLSLNTNTIV